MRNRQEGKGMLDRHEVQTERPWTPSKQFSTFWEMKWSSSSGRRDQSGIIDDMTISWKLKKKKRIIIWQNINKEELSHKSLLFNFIKYTIYYFNLIFTTTLIPDNENKVLNPGSLNKKKILNKWTLTYSVVL